MKTSIAAMLLALGFAASGHATTEAAADDRADDIYAIYSAFIDSWGADRPLVMQDHSKPWRMDPRCISTHGEHATQLEEAVEDLTHAAPQALVDRFHTKRSIRLVSEAERMEVARANETNPGEAAAIGSVSSVGFSSDGLVAVLWGGYYCGSLCASYMPGAFIKSGVQWIRLKVATCSVVS